MRAINDAIAMTHRNVLRIFRTPQLLVFSTIQPVMFVLLFNYVFGGSIRTPGVHYVDYLIPGILVQTVSFGASATAIGLADDLSRGMVDRFRSLPMSRSAMLAGRTLADLVRAMVVVTIVLCVGFLVGFRPDGGALRVLAGAGIVLLFGFSLAWVFSCVALLVKDPETAQTAGFLPLFPLVFASSIFTTTRSMPDWLASFADHQPITQVCNATRALMLGGDAGPPVLRSLAWSLGIIAVFAPLAVTLYRRI